jgi:hypothetical protein
LVDRQKLFMARKSAMKKPRKPQPAAATQFTLAASDLTLKLDPKTSLSVMVHTPDKPLKLHRNLLLFLIVCAILFALWLVHNWMYVMRTTESWQPIAFRDAQLDVAVTYPNYATFGEETELLLNVTNRGNEKFSGEVTLLFEGVIPAFPLPGEAGTAKLEQLPPGARSSHRVKFAVRQKPAWFNNGTIPVRLLVITDDCVFRPQDGPGIALAHIGLPLRAVNNFLSSPVGLALIGAVGLLLWEVIRKALFGWEAK